MYKSGASYVSCRAGVYYYTRRIQCDVRQHYASERLSFSLRTKSNAGALRAINQSPSSLKAWVTKDAIGGWETSGVGHGYGNGYPLDALEKWMNNLARD